MRTGCWALCCGCIFTAVSLLPSLRSPVLLADESAPTSWPELGREVAELVRTHFYNASQAERWWAEHGRYAESLDNADAFANRTRQVLAELRASHTGFYTPHDPEYYGLLAIFGPVLKRPAIEYDSIGIDLSAEHFVRHVFAEGPAAQAGLRRGDRILAADGQPFHSVRAFQGRAGQTVQLTVQSTADGRPREIAVVPRHVPPKAEWLAAQRAGAQQVARAGRQIAYVPMFCCAGEEYQQLLGELLVERFAAADALVIDFRDGWGGCNPTFASLFDRVPPRLIMTDRNGKATPFDRQWRKPVAILINGGSRSGKEAVAYALQKHRAAQLVGGRTAGAVLAGRCFPLSDQSLLYLAVADVTVDGVRLEGQAVAPDLAVDEQLPFAEGHDPQREAALDWAAQAAAVHDDAIRK